MSNYKESTRIENMVASLVSEHHPHLKGAQIAVAVKEGSVGENITEPPQGKIAKITKIRRVTGLYNFLSGNDLVVEVDEKLWDLLEVEEQEARLDATLCRVGNDPEKGLYLRDPIEVFPEAVNRHGFYSNELREFGDAVRQMDLPLVEAGKKATTKPMAVS
jgi:hypothetical protein